MTANDRVVLVGLRGAGKTTIGAVLADLLGVPFLDSDRFLADRWGETPAQVLRLHGEPELRRRERLLIPELSKASRGVLASGGGVPSQSENVEALKSWRAVWLDAPDSVLATRIHEDREERPLLGNCADPLEELAWLRELRSEQYQQMACCRVDTSTGDPTEIAEIIRERIRKAES